MVNILARTGWSLIFVATLVLGIFAGQSIKTEKAEAIGIPFVDVPHPCGLLPDGTATDICKGVAGGPAGVGGAIIGKIPGLPNPVEVIKDVVGGATNAVAENMLTGIVKFFAKGMVWGLKYTATLISTGVTPDITATWFSTSYQKVLWLAVFLAVMMFMIKQVQAAKEKDVGIQVRALIRISVFLFIAGGFLVNITAGAIFLVDKEITPALISQSADEIRITYDTLAVNMGDEIGGPIALVALLFFIVIAGCVSIALCTVAMAVRYPILPLIVIWMLLAFALNIIEEDWQRVKRACLAFLGAVCFPAVIGFVQLLSLASLRASDGFLVTLIAGVTAMLPVAVALWVWKKVSGSDFEIAPVKRSADAMRNWKMLRPGK